MVFPEDMPVCSPGACMWINAHGSHLNLTVYHCQLFLGLFLHHSVNTLPESCQLFSKVSGFSDAVTTAGREAEEEEVKYQWPDTALVTTCTSSCSHVAVLLPLTLSVPGAAWNPRPPPYRPVCRLGYAMEKQRTPPQLKALCPKIRSGSKFFIGYVTYLRGK